MTRPAATDGTANATSTLTTAAQRAVKAPGWTRLITSTHAGDGVHEYPLEVR